MSVLLVEIRPHTSQIIADKFRCLDACAFLTVITLLPKDECANGGKDSTPFGTEALGLLA